MNKPILSLPGLSQQSFFAVCLLFLLLASAQAFETASNTLEAKKSSLYTAHDEVLFNLDSGMLKFYEGDNTGAIDRLQKAEDGIFENYTKSVSQYTAAAATNDTVIDYAGEDNEDMYVNVFKSLAYANLGKRNDAIVEVNRFINKAKELSARHEQELIQARRSVNDTGTSDIQIEFHDSALGEYLALLYYRSIGDKSTVQSSARFISDAFKTQSSVYNLSVPKSIQEEAAVKKNATRLNLSAFQDFRPQKLKIPCAIQTNFPSPCPRCKNTGRTCALSP